jgi:hypothetical protein
MVQLAGCCEPPLASKLTRREEPGEMFGGLVKVIVLPLDDAFAPDADEKLSPGNEATSDHPLSVVLPSLVMVNSPWKPPSRCGLKS